MPTRRDVLLSSSSALVAATLLPTGRRGVAGNAKESGASADPTPRPLDAEQVTTDSEPVSLSDYEALARERGPKMAFEYISGGAADEITLKWNRESYDRIRLRPR